MSIKYLNPGYEVDGIFYASKEVRATGIPNKVLRAARDRSRRNIYRDYNNSSAGISREIERRSRPSAKARKKKYDSKRDTLAETRSLRHANVNMVLLVSIYSKYSIHRAGFVLSVARRLTPFV